MLSMSSVLLLLAVGCTVECVRNTPRSARASRNEASLEFECPEEFGYYPHPRDCTQYYVCVFGGALLESCTGGLMYSHELQTCDWPRNVGCLTGGSIAKETEEDDPLLERTAKVESIQLQHQQHHQQQQHQRTESRQQHHRQPVQRQQQVTVTSSSPPISQVTERQSRQRQPQQQQQQQQQHHQRTYQDEEYESAGEIESDRQQRVYRGQPSTIGQVQRDRDGLRRNVISGAGRHDRFDNGQQSDFRDPNPTSDPVPRRSRTQPASTDITTDYHRLSYSTTPQERDFGEGLEEVNVFVAADKDSTTVTNVAVPTLLLQQSQISNSTESSSKNVEKQSSEHSTSAFNLLDHQDERTVVTVTTSTRSTLQQPRSRDETSYSSIAAQRKEEFEKNEISVTTPSASNTESEEANSEEGSEENDRFSRPPSSRNVFQQQQFTNDFFVSPSSPSWLRSTEDVERNEISVTPGIAGRGFMVKRLRSDHRDSADDKVIPVTPAYVWQRSTTPQVAQHDRGESKTLQVSVNLPSPRQRSRNSLIPSPFQPRTTEKPTEFPEDRHAPIAMSSARKNLFVDPENRKYYITSVLQRSSASNPENDEVSAVPVHRRFNIDAKIHKTSANSSDKKYYIPSVPQRRFPEDSERNAFTVIPETTKSPVIPSTFKPSSADNKSLDTHKKMTKSSTIPSTLKTVSANAKSADSSQKVTKFLTTIKTTSANDQSAHSVTKTTTEANLKKEKEEGTVSGEDTTKNAVFLATTSSRHSSGLTGNPNEPEGNEISSSNAAVRHRQRPVFRGQARHKTQDGNRRSSTPEREKDSIVNSRGQTESHYRSISSESPRIAKTTASTTAPISKAYYSDADQSYPYYTIYDDDVSIYKDDDYGQYSVNRSVHIPQQQHQQQPQSNHHQHRQQNVRIAEVTPNSNQYSQKPKKVSDSNKYNLSPEVTVSDYDIYDSEPLKNAFRISDGQQPLRTNGLSHPVVHVTTTNAIVDTYVPLTTTTQPPPTTTARPYTVTVQTRGRPQVNRGTAPPRSRPTLKPSTAIVSKAQEFVDIYRHPAVRPPPIYPTPTVDKPAAKCRKDVCLLPDCSCGGTDIPGDYLPEEIPQIVLLTFDDSVNDLNKQLYADLFEKGRKNPNGCPISATFYVSHEWTDYSQVQNLYATGHEIASHTVSHSFGEQFSARKWAREIAGQREILAAYGGVKLEDVRGMRAPFLSVGGNNMFKMLWDTNFTYDSSMPIYENRPPSWPYTLDYKLFHDCMIPPCPTRSYPGLWEVPMVMWQDLNGGRCSMGDACSNPPTPDGVYKMLIKNFERHYTTNRAPFGLFYHAAWFTQPHHKEGFISFLDTIVAMDDVWVVTNWQALQWIRNPTPLQALDRFEPFGCNYQDRPKKCNNAKVCNLWHKSGVRYMKTCQACPDIYPWTGKTGIRSSRIDNEVEN